MRANSADAPGSLPEKLARTVRHEVGDFLQKVYATVAILQQRLPADMAEDRDLLTRLRVRAEGCRDLVDSVQDYVCAVTLAYSSVDLAEIAREITAPFRLRYPALDIEARAAAAAVTSADPMRVRQVGTILLTNACEAARQRVLFDTVPEAGGGVTWRITDDGTGVPADRAGEIFEPFFTTRPGHAGLGLALAKRLVEMHGGRIQAGNSSGEGFAATVFFPGEGTVAAVPSAADPH